LSSKVHDPMPPTASPGRVHAACDTPGGAEPVNTRQRILDIALDLFIEQGYDKTSLRQIAQQLGFTQAAIYYHFASKEDILVALSTCLHQLVPPALDSLGEESGPSEWAEALTELVGSLFANPKLFALHERNQAAFALLYSKGHGGDHHDLLHRFRRILANPAIPARARVRLSCALGALMSTVMLSSHLGDLSSQEYGDLLREAITDLLDQPLMTSPS
jgi:AcrR family transcriptional regulator